jgi:hypothetical protein
MELNVSLSETVKPVDVEKVAEFIVSLQKEMAKFRGLKAARRIRGIILKARWA